MLENLAPHFQVDPLSSLALVVASPEHLLLATQISMTRADIILKLLEFLYVTLELL